MPHNKEVVSALATMLSKGNEWDVVTYSFMNMNEPSIGAAIEEVCKDSQITSIVMAPVFVAPGVHIKEDVPEILGLSEGQKVKEMVVGGKIRRFFYADPFGADERLAQIINERAYASMEL